MSPHSDSGPIRGRGTDERPTGRFERLHYEPCEDADDVDPNIPGEQRRPSPPTELYRDDSRSILAYNDSPDVGFEVSINPYRGCEHGCVYCYARPTHEYLGLSAGLDFETKIFVKEKAPEMLRRELASPRWKPCVIALSGVTDPYQPAERSLRLTRRCLETLHEFRNPVAIITKSRLVTRDVDILRELARFDAAAVFVSVTTLRPELQRVLEPRAASPSTRLAAIETLSQAGVPVGVLVAPVLPALNDHEIPAILQAAARSGAREAGYVLLRLPHGLAPLFEDWLGHHFPDRKEKVLARIRDLRGGRLNDPRFGARMRGEGPFAEQIRGLFDVACRNAGLGRKQLNLSTSHFRNPAGRQLTLFDDA